MTGLSFFLLQINSGELFLSSNYWFYHFDATSFHIFLIFGFFFGNFGSPLKFYHIILLSIVPIGLEKSFNGS